MKNEESLNNNSEHSKDMATNWQMIGLGAVGGILITVGVFVFKRWLTGDVPFALNTAEPYFGTILVLLGFGAIWYARYGNY